MKKLSQLQSLLKKSNINAFIFSTTDEYMSEYVPESAKRLKYITDFTGSLALSIVTNQASVIFVDGRYTLQANDQVDTGFAVEDFTMANIQAWLVKNLDKNSIVALPSTVTSINFYHQIQQMCLENNFQLTTCKHHLVDEIWQNRPPVTRQSIVPYTLATISYKDKLDAIATTLKAQHIDMYLSTDLSSIAWLLNLRGHDIPYNPFFMAVSLIDADGKSKIFLDMQHISKDIINSMAERVEFLPENQLEDYLKLLSQKQIKTVAMPKLTAYYYMQLLQENNLTVKLTTNFCEEKKVIKTNQEIQNMLNAHVRDGAYLVKLFADIYHNPNQYDEMKIEATMEKIKAQDACYHGCSFASIVGINDNGAIVHYKAKASTNKKLSNLDSVLIDCGAQYEDGTTDVTRTLSLKKPTLEFKTHYTQVLKGHINLASAVFPINTKASSIDVLARQNLWQAGLDYAHGTGHGVGVYAGVHDGGVSLSANSNMVLQAGMILSIEPGVYIQGEYGIRLENLYVISKTKYPNFLCFKVLSMLPFEVKNIDYNLLSNTEKQWLEDYHLQVINNLQPLLAEQDFLWLKNYISATT